MEFFSDEIKDITELNIFLNNNKVQEKPDNMAKHCKNWENGLGIIIEEEFVLKDEKMNSKIKYLKQLLNKRKALISFQMDQIKNYKI